MDALEQGEREGGTTPKAIIDDLPLFAATPTQTAPVASEPNELEQMLNEISPDELTPREALQKLYELKGRLNKRPFHINFLVLMTRQLVRVATIGRVT